MKVSFPIKFRLLGNGQKVVTTDTESLSLPLRKEREKACHLLTSAPFSPSLHGEQYCQ